MELLRGRHTLSTALDPSQLESNYHETGPCLARPSLLEIANVEHSPSGQASVALGPQIVLVAPLVDGHSRGFTNSY